MRHMTRSTKSRVSAFAMSALVGFSLTSFAPHAKADEVSPTGKGIVGGALLGGEVVTITEAIIGVRPAWPYLLGGGLGAVGGGIGGYFVEQASSDGRAPVYMLAGGLALVIPAIVLTLNATRFQPSEEATEDKPPANAPEANPGAAGGSVLTGPSGAGGASTPTPPVSTPPATTPAPNPPPPAGTPGPPAAPLGMFDIGGGALRLGLPVPEVRPMYSLREQKAYGLPNGTEFRMPVFHLTF
jgi:hypothetical protein